jgi:hypothetical protein
VLVADVRRLRDSRLDVPEVDRLEAELLDSRIEAGVADRRRAHVDAAAPRTEVESRADDRDPAWRSRLQRHG